MYVIREKSMEESKFIEISAHILQKDAGSLSLNDELSAIGWDSLANVEFIAELDDELGIQLNSDDLSDCVTLADLYELVKSAG